MQKAIQRVLAAGLPQVAHPHGSTQSSRVLARLQLARDLDEVAVQVLVR